MNMNLLRVFHEAARQGSFTRAAAELHLTQPGISKHIRELEECCGARLFDRVSKKVLLTQAGEILYRTTSDIFTALAQAQARIHDLRALPGESWGSPPASPSVRTCSPNCWSGSGRNTPTWP